MEDSDSHKPCSLISEIEAPLLMAMVANPARNEWGVILGRGLCSKALARPSLKEVIDIDFPGQVIIGKMGASGSVILISVSQSLSRATGQSLGFGALDITFRAPSRSWSVLVIGKVSLMEFSSKFR